MRDLKTILAELVLLDAQATPGPWKVIPDPGFDCPECGETDTINKLLVAWQHSTGLLVVLCDDREKANAALVAEMRNALPALVAEIDRLTAALEATDALVINANNYAIKLLEQRKRFAARIVRDADRPGDHACARCYVGGDVVVPGFVCSYHEALDIVNGGG